MRLFLDYIGRFRREDFNSSYYLTVFLLVAAMITLNYSINLEDGIIDQIRGYFPRAAAFFLLYASLYLVALGLCWWFNKPEFEISSNTFWLSLVFGLLILSSDIAFQPYSLLNDIPVEIRIFTGKMLSNLVSVITTFIPLLLYYKLKDQDQPSFYGLTSKGFIVRPYLVLFSVVLPLVTIASFLPGFLQQYPMYLTTKAHEYLNLPEFATILSYELAYGWNFLTIELLFRGFFVIGMVRFLGRHAIIPAAIVYCSIHFGKPMGECISSFFGGYFLGIVGYYSRNIWGGVVIHIGLAWLMEVVSSIHKAILLNI